MSDGQTITADDVNNGMINGIGHIFSGAWTILAPFAAAALVLFLGTLLVRSIVSRKR
ncbi:hypothetical protein [Arthrobacter sp. B2I5]|uniref:hypothetical protein n=1 Tax=Arthrobacter sp. B2I5 TaxID=3042266 RepID=UPI0027D86937|nr:hypothetical protein [Arthrobacter sp. B2I5]